MLTHLGTRRVGRKALVVLSLVALCAMLIPLGVASAWGPRVKLIVDTDPGVDDAAALAWLLSQRRYPVDVLGVVSVVGNTEAMLGAANALMLLDAAGKGDIPVVMGAEAPLNQTNSYGSLFLHGPDGLWGMGAGSLSEEELFVLLGRLAPTTAPAFYCEQVAANPGLTVLTLGPLTNLAQAVEACPEVMDGVGQVVLLGGSRMANAPQTDYNMWQDPEAAEIVLESGLPLKIVLVETSGQFVLDENNVEDLLDDGNAVAQFVAGPMQMYLAAEAGFFGGEEQQKLKAAYYDVVAAMYAAGVGFAKSESALVKMVTEESLARGQTIVGLSFSDRIGILIPTDDLNYMIFASGGDPDVLMAMMGEVLMANPDNADVVLDISERWMRRLFMRDLTR
jgi:purine nucleosidase